MHKSSPPLFRGSATALITPFLGGKIDFDCFEALVDANIRAGADALVVAGTTGEASTLSPDEQAALCACAVQAADGRVPIICGAGSSDTAHACALVKQMCRAGCDALLCVTPYYNKATPRGLELHFCTIAEAAERPIMLYHVPGRTGCTLPLAVCKALATHPNVCGIKEASGDVAFAARIIAACGDALPLYAGNDNLTLPLLSLGAQGVISVAGNIIPATMREICHAYFAGDTARARQAHLSALGVMDACMAQVNPIPIKTACAMQGLCREEFRLPLCPMLPAEKQALTAALREYGLM